MADYIMSIYYMTLILYQSFSEKWKHMNYVFLVSVSKKVFFCFLFVFFPLFSKISPKSFENHESEIYPRLKSIAVFINCIDYVHLQNIVNTVIHADGKQASLSIIIVTNIAHGHCIDDAFTFYNLQSTLQETT